MNFNHTRTQVTCGNSRTGNTLVVTLIMAVIAIGIIGLASENLAANQTLTLAEQQHKKAQFTAESLAAIIERKLYDLAAKDTALLKEDLDSPANRSLWYNLRGFDYGGSAGSSQSALYLDGCALRWRLEPVKVLAKTKHDVTLGDYTPFFVNSERDPNLQYIRRTEAGPGLIENEAQHFYFNIAVEAYFLKDNNDTSSIPWRQSGKHTAMAQIQRVIQLEEVNPFRYILNYIADGHTGDLELFPSTSVTFVDGGVRSNERIFLSSSSGNVQIGSGSTPVPIEASNGIFRLHKPAMYKDGVYGLTRQESPYNERQGSVLINGKELDPDEDSRTKLEGKGIDSHHIAVRDGSEFRDVEEDLDTYLAWNNGFLGHCWVAGPGTPLYRYPASDGSSEIYSIRPSDPYYHPGVTPERLSGVHATGLPLFKFAVSRTDKTNTFTDVWPFSPGSGGQAYGRTFPNGAFNDVELISPDTGLPPLPLPLPPSTIPPTPMEHTDPRAANRDLFSRAIGSTSRKTTGLVIRERGRQVGAPTPNPRLPTDGSSLSVEDLRVYNNWLKNNYVVYLGRVQNVASKHFETVDITEEFFDFSLKVAVGGSAKTRDLMAHEDVFLNRRDHDWFAVRGQSGVMANVLTVNVGRLSQFLKSPVGKRFPLGGKYESYFNGMIYIERNPRVLKIDGIPCAFPLAPWGNHPLGLGHDMNINDDAELGTIPLARVFGQVDAGETSGPVPGSSYNWAVFPHTRGVRIDNAQNSDLRRMTIITPGMCYVWGDFNTAGGKNVTPCALYCDGITVLSNAWQDKTALNSMLPLARDTTIRAAVVTHNVPTDRTNATVGGSGGAQNILRLLENWTATKLFFTGSIVVAGRMNYTRAPVSLNGRYHQDPTLIMTFNPKLLSASGQPPASFRTTRATRVLSNISR